MTKTRGLGALVPLTDADCEKLTTWLKNFREADLSTVGVASIRNSFKKKQLREPVRKKLRELTTKDVAAACAPAKKKIVYQWATKERIPLPLPPTTDVKTTCPYCNQEIVRKV